MRRCAIWFERGRQLCASPARQHLQGFLLRNDRTYPGEKGWTKAYRRWLTTVRFERPAQQIVLQDYIHAVTDAETRIERLTGQIADLLPSWSLAPVRVTRCLFQTTTNKKDADSDLLSIR